jgi:hypothetical protein
MAEMMFGLVLLAAGVISFLTVRRADAKGGRILRDWAPNSDRKVTEGRTALSVGLHFCLPPPGKWFHSLRPVENDRGFSS